MGNENTWEFEGHTIALNGTGGFWAKVGAQKITAPSLQGVKNKIKALKVTGFVPFNGLDFSHFWKEAKEVEIVEVRRTRGRLSRLVFVDKQGREHQSIYEDTPENRERIATYVAMLAADTEEKERRDQARDEVLKTITVRKAQ